MKKGCPAGNATGRAPAVQEGERGQQRVERRGTAAPEHFGRIAQRARVEMSGGPRRDGRVHAVLLRQHAGRLAALVARQNA
jgi:hypothetical protein